MNAIPEGFGPSTPVILFTGQWADLAFEEVVRLAARWGYAGLEIAASGDHLDLLRAESEAGYLEHRQALMGEYGLKAYAISNYLAGQSVCDDPIDFRHQSIMRPYVWGDGNPEGIRNRAAEDMKRAARVARRLNCDTVVGFSGSKIWKYLAMFPPVSATVIAEGFEDFADRWNPILDVFDCEGVRFALEVHPSEIAYDFWTSKFALEALGGRDAFGFNWDPSHMVWQGLDPAQFILEFGPRIYHTHCKDIRLRPADGRRGVLSSHLPWGDFRRRWDFVSAGHGDVHWQDCFRALADIGYQGPISVEWEDVGMDRMVGAPEALEFVKKMLWQRSDRSFDSSFNHQ